MSTLQITIGTITDRGLNPRRTANEDRLLALPESGLFLVADGVGGHRGGQVASQTAVDVFTEVFATRPAGDMVTLVRQTIAQANRKIFQASHEVADLEGMASTLALVAIEGNRAVIAHVGDSRVYRFDGRKLHAETEDHSEVNDAVRAGTMTVAQAANHPHRNIINRALGADAEVEADLKVVTLDARTSFLLCSDGITRHIPDAEMEKLLNSGQHPNNICAQMKDLCFARGAEDNLTAVIADCGERAYVEEATRPTVPRSAISLAAAAATPSRISVDFEETLPTAKPLAKPATAPTVAKRSSLVSGLVQLVLLVALIVAAVVIARNWEQLYGWVMGKPPASAAAGTPASTPVKIDPDLAAAQALFEEKRYDKARESFTALVAKDGNNAEYRYWLGRSHYELKQPAEAVKQLTEAAKLNDKLPSVFVHLARAQEAAGDKKGASESLKRAVATPETTPLAISPTPAG
ncbi:MAG: protein phosphatase 2C domain-containing protein [Blastocatellia bacterium]